MTSISDQSFTQTWTATILAHWPGSKNRSTFRQAHEEILLRELRRIRATAEEFQQAAEQLVFENAKNRPPELKAFVALILRARKEAEVERQRQQPEASREGFEFWKLPKAFIDLVQRLEEYPPVKAQLGDGSHVFTVFCVACDPKRGYCLRVRDVEDRESILWPDQVERYQVEYIERLIGVPKRTEATPNTLASVEPEGFAEAVAAAIPDEIPF